jgi:hypothetical protein
MRERIEDLLSIRDREPVEAGLRERISHDETARTELLRLERTREELASLPEIDPPAHAWDRIRTELAAPAERPRDRRAWLFASAAAVLMSVALILVILTADVDEPPIVPVITQVPSPGDAAARANVVDRDFQTLIEQSAALERMLTRLPEHRRRIRIGTASTILGLEDQIAVIDAQLSFAAANDFDARYQQALWTERVDLMNALVYVRYAYEQTVGF